MVRDQSELRLSPIRPKLSTGGAPHINDLLGPYQFGYSTGSTPILPSSAVWASLFVMAFELPVDLANRSPAMALSFSSTFLVLSSTVSTAFFISPVNAFASASTSSNTSCRTARILYAQTPTTKRVIIPPVTMLESKKGRRARLSPGETPCMVWF